jgi:hypothetical protein
MFTRDDRSRCCAIQLLHAQTLPTIIVNIKGDKKKTAARNLQITLVTTCDVPLGSVFISHLFVRHLREL